MTTVFIKKGNLDTDIQPGKMPCQDEGRALHANESQRLSANQQKLGDRHGAETPSEGTDLANNLISNFQPPQLGDNTFLLLKSSSLWYVVMGALGN